VGPIIANLAKHNPFLLQTHGYYGGLTICSLVKFLAAEKMICYACLLVFSKNIVNWDRVPVAVAHKSYSMV